MISRVFSTHNELEAVPPEVRSEVLVQIRERRSQIDRWFFMVRMTIGLALVGYMSIDAVKATVLLPQSIALVLAYLVGNLIVWIFSLRRLSSTRWWYILLDLAFIMILRHQFLFEAMVDPNATMVGLYTLILISYAAYSDPDLSRSIAFITLLSTAGTLTFDLIQIQGYDSQLVILRSHPLRIVLLMTYLGAFCLFAYLLALRLQKQLLVYSIELQKRMQASITTAFERTRREKLEELDRLKQNFILILSHELRTPIAPLRSSLEIAKAEIDQQSGAVEMLNIALESTKKLQRLVQDYTQLAELLTLNRNCIIRRNIRLSNLITAIQNCLESPYIFSDGLEDLVVSADPHLLGGALLAILRRAELVTSKNAPITIHGCIVEDMVHLSVHEPVSVVDTDIALSLDDPFTSNNERTFYSQNTGIELVLARHAIHRMGGGLHIESTPRQGTTVTCTLQGKQHGVQWLDGSQLKCELESLAEQHS